MDKTHLNKILASRIQQYVIQYEEVKFKPEIQGWFTIQESFNLSDCVSRIQEKIHITISIGVKKAFIELNIHSLQKVKKKKKVIKRDSLNLNRISKQKLQLTSHLRIRLKVFPHQIRNKTRMHTLTTSVLYCYPGQ